MNDFLILIKGPRYEKRGIDFNGNSANEVETE